MGVLLPISNPFLFQFLKVLDVVNKGMQSELDPELGGDDAVFSSMALVAFLLSLGSAGVLASTNLVPLSFGAILLGFIPLIASRKWGLSKVSVFLAASAVTLGIFFVSWASTRQALMNQRLANQATKFAMDYIDVLKKKDLETAFRLGMDLEQINLLGKEAPSMYNTIEATRITEAGFIGNPARSEIMERGDSADWRVIKYQIRNNETGQAVRLSFQDKSRSNPRTLGIMLYRERAEDSPPDSYYWSVSGMQYD